MSQNLSIENLAPGMTLAQDVTDAGGKILLKAGTKLTEGIISKLATLGVESVTVNQGGGAECTAPNPEHLAQAEEYARRFFLFLNLHSPPVRELYCLTLSRLAQRMGEGWQPPTDKINFEANAKDLRDMFFKGEGTAEDLVQDEIKLVSFPDIYFKIREVLESPTSSAEHVAEVVGLDTSLSARLLKLVNSPLYGFPSTIDSIPRAVALVGASELSSLALGVSAVNVFKDIPPELVDMEVFWKHSIACGLFARLLANHIPGLKSERFFVAGLLHDIGRLVMFKKLPYASAQALAYSRENSIPLVEAEQDVLGFNHALVGGLLCSTWNFPESLTDMVRYHHDPGKSLSPLEPSIIRVADTMTVVREVAMGSQYVVPEIKDEAWEALGISTEIIALLFEEFEQQFDQILSDLLGGSA